MTIYQLSEDQKNQKYFQLSLVHGKVIKEHMWAELHVSGRGHRGTSSTSTSISRKREIVVRTAEGIEKHFRVNGDECQISENQLVSMLVEKRVDQVVREVKEGVSLKDIKDHMPQGS